VTAPAIPSDTPRAARRAPPLARAPPSLLACPPGGAQAEPRAPSAAAEAPPARPSSRRPIYAPQAPQVFFPKPKAAPKRKPASAAAAAGAGGAEGEAGAAAPPPARPQPLGDTAAGVPRYGCPKCRYMEGGCAKCLRGPTVKACWVPAQAVPQADVPPVPTYHPSEAEWADPLAFVASIRAEGERYGIVRIVPPASWKPPFSLPNKDALRFPTRIQALHELQHRAPGGPVVTVRRLPSRMGGAAPSRMGGGGGGRMGGGGGGRMGGAPRAPAGEAAPPAAAAEAAAAAAEPPAEAAAAEGAAASAAAPAATAAEGSAGGAEAGAAAAPPSPPQEAEEPAPYGFRPGDKHTLASLERYSRYFKAKYFCGRGGKPKEGLSVEEMEGEFWRLVETGAKGAGVEVIYGADIQTGEVGSGFPAAPCADAEAARYAAAPFNVCNMPFTPGSALKHVERTTGISVPWLYFGMTLSAFCWHVEDHHFYSINYHHWGDAKVWYSIPAAYSARFEQVLKERLPHLFAAQPDLLHSLVTLVSPATLRAAGIPVYRAVQEPGNYILTFPFAYHAGFNAGFNCAEATNFAPADWLPFGLDASERYSADQRYCSVAHDAMLLALGRAVRQAGEHPSLAPTVCAELDRRALLEVGRRAEAAAWAAGEERMSEAQAALCADTDCAVCLADLHISALFCDCAPRQPSCLRHPGCACPAARRRLAYRYSLEELRAEADAVRAVADPGQTIMRPLAERFGADGASLPPRPLASAAEAAAAFEEAVRAAALRAPIAAAEGRAAEAAAAAEAERAAAAAKAAAAAAAAAAEAAAAEAAAAAAEAAAAAAQEAAAPAAEEAAGPADAAPLL